METKDIITLSISMLALVVAGLSLWLTIIRDRREVAARSVRVTLDKSPWDPTPNKSWPFTVYNPSDWPVILIGVLLPSSEFYQLSPAHPPPAGMVGNQKVVRTLFQYKSIRVEPGDTQAGNLDILFTDVPRKPTPAMPITFVFNEIGPAERHFRKVIHRSIDL